jgi:2-keto-3-deoxy-L-fuconate dehydrogenase
MNKFNLTGRRALVTGGGRGIGAAVCRALDAAGAHIIVADIDKTHAEALALELKNGKALPLDITDQTAVTAAFSEIASLDILVNNAGIGHVGNIEETDFIDFQRLFRVNVEGTFLVSKAAASKLIASNGVIINIGSVAGLIGLRRRFAYSATKGAVIAMSRQMAVDYAGRIRVNCVCPGTIDTPFVDEYLEKFHKHEKEKVRLELNARQPMGRMGTPEEIASMVLYLASNEASFVTGSALTIDGGLTAA